MKKLFRIELCKILNYTSFRVILGLHLALFFLVIIITSQIEISVPGFKMRNLFQFPYVWESFSWIASWFNLLLAILVIVLVGNEFSFNTFRQHVIDGLSRNDLFLGKGIVILLIAVYGFLLVLLSSLIFGFIFSKDISFAIVFKNSYLLIVYFIQAIAYMTMGLFLAILLKNNALSIVIFILYFALIEPIIRSFFSQGVRRFFPVKIISNLTPAPEFLTITSGNKFSLGDGSLLDFEAIGILPEKLPLFTTVFIAVSYIALFAFIATLIMNKRNL